MTTFKELESEYLEIDPLDSNKLDRFYHKHMSILTTSIPADQGSERKRLSMLIDIGCSYSFAYKHQEALTVFRQVKRKMNAEVNSSLPDNLNQMHFCTGNSNLALKNYLAAWASFRLHEPGNKDKPSLDLLIRLCRDKFFNKILLTFAILGLLILTIKYSTKWFFPDYYSATIDRLGWPGAIALFSYGLFNRTTKRKNTA
jgi:hypothetical protein